MGKEMSAQQVYVRKSTRLKRADQPKQNVSKDKESFSTPHPGSHQRSPAKSGREMADRGAPTSPPRGLVATDRITCANPRRGKRSGLSAALCRPGSPQVRSLHTESGYLRTGLEKGRLLTLFYAAFPHSSHAQGLFWFLL